jgi:hypothetical protein
MLSRAPRRICRRPAGGTASRYHADGGSVAWPDGTVVFDVEPVRLTPL